MLVQTIAQDQAPPPDAAVVPVVVPVRAQALVPGAVKEVAPVARVPARVLAAALALPIAVILVCRGDKRPAGRTKSS